ncbi:MAG: hypothetical protein D6701_09110, partial [Gemmatimonadetes bacterium]
MPAHDLYAPESPTPLAPGGGYRRALATSVVFVACAWAFDILKDYTALRLVSAGEPYLPVLADNAPFWVAWMALTPLLALQLRRAGRLRGDAAALAVHVALGALGFSLLHLLLHPVVRIAAFPTALGWAGVPRYLGYSFDRFMFGEVAQVTLLQIVYLALEFRRQAHASRLQAERLRAQAASARLEALQRQLNPHFLFNALNSVSGLVRRGEERAAVETLARLGDLLRSTLALDGRLLLPLGEELMLLDDYLALAQVRFRDRLRAEVDVPEPLLDVRVPPLLLQPLAENVVHHGLRDAERPVTLRVRARRTAEG